jgi:hypothetical protein
VLDPRTLIQSIGSLRLWVVLDRGPGSARRAFVTMGCVYGWSAYSEAEYAPCNEWSQ